MGAFADYFASQAPAAEPVEPVDDSPGQFGRGLRSGLSGAYSQLQAAAGGVAEAAGFPEFAADRYQAMRDAQAEAEANAPRVGSYKDVHGIRDAYDYVTGVIGQSVPQSVATVGGALMAKTPVGRAVGATLANVPFESGDVIQRQQNDPVSMQQDAVTRGKQALEGGVASAAAQSILPTMVAGKMAAPVMGAERVGARQALREGLRELPAAMALEGGTEGAGEVAKQVAHQASNPELPMDWEQVKENVVGGAAAGGAMHGAGVAVQAGRAGLASPANALVDVAGGAKDAVLSGARKAGERLSGAADSAAAGLEKVGEKVGIPDPVEAIKGIYDKGTTQARAFWESVASGEDTANLLAKAGKTAEQIKEALPTIDADRLQKVTQAAKDLWENKGLTDPQRAQLSQAMQDLGNKANQQFVAAMELGRQQGGELAGRAKGLFDSFADKLKTAVEGTKKSEDFSGVREQIATQLMPKLQEIYPNLMAEPQTLQHVADGVRMAIQGLREGGVQGLKATQIARLWDTFGDHTVEILDGVQKALGGVKPEESNRLYEALNEMRMQRREQDKTLGLMQRSLRPELQDTMRTSDIRQELQVLRDWMQRHDRNSAEGRFRYETLKFDLDTRYGKNADKILEAVEKETRPQENVIAKEDTANMAEVDAKALGDRVEYGPEKGGLALHPKLDPAGEKGQAVQAAERARKQNPDRHIRFLSAEDLGEDHPAVQHTLKALQSTMAPEQAREELKKYGMTVAEGQRDAGQITKDDLKSIQVKDNAKDVGRSKYDQPSIFKVDNTAYDAIAMTKLIARQFKDEFSDADNRQDVNRRARMFLTGVAALQDHLGKTFELSPDLVIDHQGTTVADLKKLDLTPQMKGAGGDHPSLAALEGRLAQAEENLNNARGKGKDADTIERLQAKLDKAERALRTARLQELLQEYGRYKPDPMGPASEGALLSDDAPHNNLTGNSREKDQGLGGALPKDEEVEKKSGPVKGTADVLRDKLKGWADNPPSAAAKAVAEKGLALLDNKSLLTGKEKKGLAALLSEGTKASQVAGTINAMYKKYEGKLGAVAEAAKPEGVKTSEIDANFVKEKHPEFETDKEAHDYLLQAYKRFGELAAEETRLRKLDEDAELPDAQRKAFFKLAETFAGDSHADLGSFLPSYEMPDVATDRRVRAYLKKAAPEVAAQLPKSFSSLQATGTQRVTSQQMQDVRKYVDQVLGKQVRTSLANILHAGEYVPASDTIRISVHALNPTTVAYHEALHAFLAKLAGQGNGEVGTVLKKAATSAPILNQLRTLLANEHAALAQLSDPEEAAAYMYQFWAAGQLKVGDRARNVFERIRDAIARVFGVWSNDQRAEAIMDYFHSGEFASKGLGQPNAVARALLQTGRNQVLEHARELTKPLVQAADALTTAGGQRLRDTGVPALRQLADMMKATGRDGANDAGYVPAARAERTRVMNDFGQQMRGFTEAQMHEALEAMQNGTRAASKEARMIQSIVQSGPNALLPRMLKYMQDAGVDLKKVSPRPDYFPRLYDAHYISRHQQEFQRVLENHGFGQREARETTLKLVAADGAEFTIERDRPGMQFAKTRKLVDIPDAELAPFMRKNLFEIMSSYVSQATRRAEWARRFGDDGLQIERLKKQAQAQGATKDQLDAAEKFVRAVDGTLGDTLAPGARRLMGNMIVYQNLRLLPLAIFSSVVDPLGIMVRGGTVRDAFSTLMRGFKEIPSSIRGNFTPDVQTRMAETLGVIDDAMLSDTVGQLYTQGLVGDTARKINDTFFRFNLMEGFNRSMRVGATQAAIAFLNHHRDGTASPHSARWLAELGLRPGFSMDLADPKVRAAVNMWVDGAVLRPDAVDKPIWMNDPHYMLLSHLKQFVYSFQETILKRVWHEYMHGNYAPAMALASYVPVMIASDALKGVLQGGGDMPEWKKDWGPAEYLGSGIERAGLLGKLQFPVDGVGMMAGPTAQQALQVAEALDGKGGGSRIALKALPANPIYAEWLGASGDRTENSMSID